MEQTWDGWAQSVLEALGAPITDANIHFLETWQQFEQSSATYNPLNTTQGSQYSILSGTPGVRNFPDPQTGAQQTAATLKNGYYPNLLNALLSGNPASVPAAAIGQNLSTWGTGTWPSWIQSALSVNHPFVGPTQSGGISQQTAQAASDANSAAWKKLAGAAFLPSLMGELGIGGNAAGAGLLIGAVVVGIGMLIVGVIWLAGGEITSSGVASAAVKHAKNLPALLAE